MCTVLTYTHDQQLVFPIIVFLIDGQNIRTKNITRNNDGCSGSCSCGSSATKKSFRVVALAYGIDKMTLYRYCKKLRAASSDEGSNSQDAPKVTSGYAKARQIFSDAQEQELVQYLLDASKMFFGLSAKETRKLAYEFATALGKEVPATWKARQSAGEDWFSGFMRHHQNTLSVRTPEATSLSRVTSFNRTNANLTTIWKVCITDFILSLNASGTWTKLD